MNKLELRRGRFSIPIFGVLAALLSLTAADVPAPPVAKKIPHITEIHGRKLVDNYFWLRDKNNPEVAAYLRAENAYTEAVMKPTEAFQARLYDEMLSRIQETDVEVPYKQGEYFYYSRSERGKQYEILCRKKGGLDAPEEVVLDVNELAQGKAFMAVGAYEISQDGNLLAYSTDDTGFRQYSLAVKDLRTGKQLVDHAVRVGSVVWANDDKTIFYTVEDPTTKRIESRNYEELRSYSGRCSSNGYLQQRCVAVLPIPTFGQSAGHPDQANGWHCHVGWGARSG